VAGSDNAADRRGPVVNLEGQRVALGPLQLTLLPAYGRWLNDWVTIRPVSNLPRPLTEEAIAAWYRQVTTDDTQVRFTIFSRATGQPVGITMLQDIDRDDRTAEFGILIGEADARGKGYGTETTRLMLDFAFTTLGLNTVALSVDSYHAAAIAAYVRAGFREFGRRRSSRSIAGRRYDSILMECLANEFSGSVLAPRLAR
jgi:RimJ/RimL family protein N-acetyltransferase